MHIDHFIALANNGTHSMGNLVPSCQRCNHSKGSKDPKTWYFSQEFATKKGWKAILKTVGVKDATYNIPLLV
jgi:5-methylcytosine-specific restriction endonuclease McrA